MNIKLHTKNYLIMWIPKKSRKISEAQLILIRFVVDIGPSFDLTHAQAASMTCTNENIDSYQSNSNISIH